MHPSWHECHGNLGLCVIYLNWVFFPGWNDSTSTSFMTLKNKNWMHGFEFILDFL